MEEKLKESYVAYLDVLGFTEMVYSDYTDKITSYQHALEQKVLSFLCADFPEVKFLTISDSIVLLIEHNQENKVDKLKKLFKVVQKIQVILVEEDIWIRGGVSSGMVR